MSMRKPTAIVSQPVSGAKPDELTPKTPPSGAKSHAWYPRVSDRERPDLMDYGQSASGGSIRRGGRQSEHALQRWRDCSSPPVAVKNSRALLQRATGSAGRQAAIDDQLRPGREAGLRRNRYPTWTAVGMTWLAGFDFELKVVARNPTGPAERALETRA